MGDISIKINIADRLYPLTIDMEEEEAIRKAAKLINDRLKEYQESYSVRDKQDLLSMAVLHYATTAYKAEQRLQSEDTSVGKKIAELDELLTGFLSIK